MLSGSESTSSSWQDAPVAIEYFHHSKVSRKHHGGGDYTRNHAVYVMRKSATAAWGSCNLPKTYKAILDVLARDEQGLRANGVIEHRMRAAIPKELTQEQAVEAIRLYTARISNRWDPEKERWLRARCLWSFHNDRPGHPHLHVILRDRDVDDGKSRVFGATALGGPERLKQMFFDTCNEVLERHGYEERIIRKRDRELAQEAENDNEIQPIPDMEPAEPEVAPTVPESPNTLVADNMEPDELEPPELEPEEEELPSDPFEGWSAVQRVQYAYDANESLDTLNAARSSIASLESRIEALQERLEHDRDLAERFRSTAEDLQVKAVSAIRDFEDNHRDMFGRLKGFGLPFNVGGFELKTSARVNAETAQRHAKAMDNHATNATRLARDQAAAVARLEAGIVKAEANIAETRRKIAEMYHTRGTDQEMAEAGRIFAERQEAALRGIDREELDAAIESGELDGFEARYVLEKLEMEREIEEERGW